MQIVCQYGRTGVPGTRIKPGNIFYGWWIVAAGGVVQLYTSAVFWRGFAVFFGPIVETFGWSRGATAAAVSLQRVEGGMISPFVGTLIDRYGPRKVMAFGVTATGSGFIMMSLVQSLWQFYLSVIVLTVGMSFGTFIVFVVTVGNWFIRRRARALAVLMSASAIGGITIPLLSASVDWFGWRQVLFAVGIGFWVVGFPAMLVMRRRPEEYGMLPDGDAPRSESDDPADPSARHHRPHREAAITAREALKMRFFWQLAIAASLGQLVSSTNLLHVDALTDFGVSGILAAFAVGAVAGGDLLGRVGIGVVGDRLNKRYLMAGAFAVQTLGVVGLALVNAEVFGISLGLFPLPVFVACFGLGFGASIPLRLAILADYFGRRSYGSIVGITSTVSAGFAAAGPLFAGVMFDLTGTYRVAFLVLGALLATAVPMTVLLESQGRVAAQARRAIRRSRLGAGSSASAMEQEPPLQH